MVRRAPSRATRPTTTSATAWRWRRGHASFPLTAALDADVCIERYPGCMEATASMLASRAWRNAHGILAAHPIAPFIKIHHVEFVDPIYPGLNSLESLELLRSVPSVLLPPELERSERTYIAFKRMSQRTEFDFDTKEIQKSMCKKPVLFFLKDVWKDGNITRGSYIRSSERDDLKRKVFCFRSPPLSDIDEIQVSASPLSKRWHLAPRRLCSAVKGYVNDTLFMFVRQCGRGAFGSASDSLD
ncbi:hypothetical protein ZWY2020_039234 [Hordeum vulgare]|nr:hypothetical protein ZWY2020_039234 [Hordeum vulgare]